MYIVPVNDDQFIQIIKIIKLGKNMGRNEKTHIGIPMSNIGIPMWVFQLQRRNSEGGERTIEGEELY